MFGPIANEVGKSHDLHPYRRANVLDGFANTIPVIVPVISAFIFIVVVVVQGLQGEYSFIQDLNPLKIAISTLYPICLFIVLGFSVMTGWGREFEGKNGERVKKIAEAKELN